jgi:hypothetical protein
MKTYPVWCRFLSWRERFMKRSISASIHNKCQRPVLGRISALFIFIPLLSIKSTTGKRHDLRHPLPWAYAFSLQVFNAMRTIWTHFSPLMIPSLPLVKLIQDCSSVRLSQNEYQYCKVDRHGPKLTVQNHF